MSLGHLNPTVPTLFPHLRKRNRAYNMDADCSSSVDGTTDSKSVRRVAWSSFCHSMVREVLGFDTREQNASHKDTAHIRRFSQATDARQSNGAGVGHSAEGFDGTSVDRPFKESTLTVVETVQKSFSNTARKNECRGITDEVLSSANIQTEIVSTNTISYLYHSRAHKDSMTRTLTSTPHDKASEPKILDSPEQSARRGKTERGLGVWEQAASTDEASESRTFHGEGEIAQGTIYAITRRLGDSDQSELFDNFRSSSQISSEQLNQKVHTQKKVIVTKETDQNLEEERGNPAFQEEASSRNFLMGQEKANKVNPVEEKLKKEERQEETFRAGKVTEAASRQEKLREEILKLEKLRAERLRREKMKEEEKLREDKLRQVKLQQYQRTEEKLREENLKEEKLKDEKLRQTKLREEKLENIKEEKLKFEKLREEKLREEKLRDKKQKEEKIRKEELREEKLRNEKLREEKLKSEKIKDRQINDQNIREAKLREENPRDEKPKAEKLREEKLREETLQEARLRGEKLKQGNLKQEKFREEKQKQENISEGKLRIKTTRQENFRDDDKLREETPREEKGRHEKVLQEKSRGENPIQRKPREEKVSQFPKATSSSGPADDSTRVPEPSSSQSDTHLAGSGNCQKRQDSVTCPLNHVHWEGYPEKRREGAEGSGTHVDEEGSRRWFLPPRFPPNHHLDPSPVLLKFDPRKCREYTDF